MAGATFRVQLILNEQQPYEAPIDSSGQPANGRTVSAPPGEMRFFLVRDKRAQNMLD